MRLLRAIVCILVAAGLIVCGAFEARAEKRVALVIGNSAYKNATRLLNPANDAADMAAALKRVGFETVVGLDLDRAGMEDAAIKFARLAREADVAMFYYAGHAMQHSGVNYLMPVDALLTDEADLRRMARIDEIVADLQQAKNLRILVLDACRDNPLAEAFKRSVGATRSAAVQRGLARLDSPQGMIVAYATQSGRTADDGTGRNSPYTAALLKHIETPAEIGTVFRRVSADVYEATQRQQLPELSLSVIGEFYLRGRPDAVAVPPAASPAPPAFDPRTVEISYWDSVRNSSSQEVVRSYLDRFPNGTFTVPARARIQELEQQSRMAALPPSTAPPTTTPGAPTASVPGVPAVAVPTRGTIPIGVAGPMTGPNAAFGMQLKNGAEQAVADINAAGGVLGQRLALELADDQCDPRQAVSVANRLAGNQVAFVAGHFCSSSSIPASEVYAKGNVLQITPASTNPRFTEQNLWNTFRVVGRDDQQGKVAGTHIARAFKGKSVALLHDHTTYGKSLAEETGKALNQAGSREKFVETFYPGEKDYATIVGRLRREAIDVVFVGGLGADVGLILRQMRAAGLKTVLIAGDGVVGSELPLIAGAGVEGALFTFSPDPRKKPSAATVVKKFRDKSIEPEGYTLYVYAAVQVWAKAVAKAGTTDARRVADTLKSGQWDSVLGHFGFDAKGDITVLDYVVYRFDRAGNYAELGGN